MKLQDDLNEILDWSCKNNMELHEQKFELLNHLHNSKSSLPDLGVQVSIDLNWSRHIGSMVSKARNTLSWFFSVFKTRDRVVMTTLYKSLVRSTLEYCCPLWIPVRLRKSS